MSRAFAARFLLAAIAIGCEELFFRQQLLAIAALKRLANQCPFVERDERLLQMAIESLTPQCAAVAVYERKGSAYQLRAGHGVWPGTVDPDDRVFVSLRAGHHELDMHNLPNSIATEGVAFPMAVAETLTGAVICRPRDGEQFAADVRSVGGTYQPWQGFHFMNDIHSRHEYTIGHARRTLQPAGRAVVLCGNPRPVARNQ